MLSYRIKKARSKIGLTQGQLAEMLNKSRTTIVNWETGYAKPDQDTLPFIAKALNVSEEWLLDTSNEEFESMEIKISEDTVQEMTNAKKIGARLRYYRNRKGITGDEVAKYLNVTRTTISGYETGNREPNFETLILLSKLYDMSVDNLLGINPAMNNGLVGDAWINELLSSRPEKQVAMKRIWETIRDL